MMCRKNWIEWKKFPLQFSCLRVCTELYFADNFYFHLREYCISAMKLMHTKIVNGCANPNPFGARSTNITFAFLLQKHTALGKKTVATHSTYTHISTMHAYELICKIIETVHKWSGSGAMKKKRSREWVCACRKKLSESKIERDNGKRKFLN